MTSGQQKTPTPSVDGNLSLTYEQISRRKIQTLISNSDIKALASFVDDIERIVNIMTKERFIHLACHTQDPQFPVVHWLIDTFRPNIFVTDLFGNTPILIAAFMGNFALFRYLHEEKGCPLDEINNHKDNLAHLAASTGVWILLNIYKKMESRQMIKIQKNKHH